jgi:hypothetical protein
LALVAIALAAPARADDQGPNRTSEASPGPQEVPSRGEATVDGSVTTLLAGHADPRDGRIYTVVPAYALLDVLADLHAPFVEDLRIKLSGWGNAMLGDPSWNANDGRATGDLDLGYAEGKLLHRRVTIRLGRQLLVGGAARTTQMDGASATLQLWRGIGVTGYGGAPVTPRFGTSRGDALAGGRLFWRRSYNTEVGASFIHVLGEGRVARQDAALDARWAPLRGLTLTGYGLFSLRELRLAEASAAASWQPIPMLQIAADYRRTAPDLFVPLTSIFSVFSQETRDEVGGSVWARPAARLRLDGDYHFIVDEAGFGHRGGGRAQLVAGPATLGAEARVVRLPQNGYVQLRAYGMERLDAWLFTLDADTYLLEQPIHGQTVSVTAAATVGWDFKPGWRAVVTGIADVTPLVERRFECLAKLVYNHTFRLRESKP